MLSVIFATYNGSLTLPMMLDTFCKIKKPDNGWKLIAIDNASTDDTSNILAKYSEILPLEIVYCSERGKNKSLNKALPLIEGDLVVFTDDDIIPNDNWLIELEDYAQNHPEFDIFGGKIIPYWMTNPPKWLVESPYINTSIVYAVTPDDFQEGEIDPSWIWGPNMMIRAKIFKAGYKYNESVGPTTGAYIMGSETEFTTRLHNEGKRCYYVPSAIVKHMIRPNQMERNWILKRAFRHGKSVRYNKIINEHSGIFEKLIGIRPWQIRRIIECSFSIIILRSLLLKNKSFKYEWDLYWTFGQIYQHIKP